MVSAVEHASTATAYKPPTIKPPEHQLGLLSGLVALARNPITIWPESMYQGAATQEGFVPGRRVVSIAHPALVKRVLLDDHDSYTRPKLLKRLLSPGLGDGLLTSDGDRWRRQRRIAAPSFRMQEIRAMTPVMARAGAAAGERLARQAAVGAPQDVMPEMIRATFDVITDASLGEESQGLFDRAVFAADLDVYINTLGLLDPLDVMNAPRWIPQPWKWRARRATENIRATASRVVAARREAGAGGATLVDRLIQAVDPENPGQALTDQEVVDNVVTFFGAGHETTAVTLTWALMVLADQPELQEALRAEVQQVAGDAPIDAEHVDQLALHTQVIKETLRLYPPAAGAGRGVGKATELGPYKLKPGDDVLIAIYVMHRSTALWERPQEFDPSRFAPNAPPVDRYAYLPFGGGPRICIGMGFAMLEGVAMLAEILRRVRLTPGPEREIVPLLRITLRPKGGMPLGVEAI